MSTSGVKDDNYKPDQNDDIVDGIFEFVEKSTLENLLSDVSASQDEYMVDLGDLESDRGDTAMSCPKCGANKVAISRAQGLDSLIIRFTPRRPYRCLRCYHRFWRQEKFSADSRRIWSWVLLLLLITLLVLIKSQSIQRFFSQIESDGDHLVLSSDPPTQANSNPKQQSLDGYGFQGPDPQALSAEELQLRLEQAKLEEKRVEQANQLKQAELASQLTAQPAETESLLRLDINYRIELWRKAWQEGDSDLYLDMYSSEFKPGRGLSYRDWREQRYQRVVPERDIKLKLSDFKVIFSDNYQSATVEFNQHYQSNGLANDSRKKLLLIKLSDQWYIVTESTIGS